MQISLNSIANNSEARAAIELARSLLTNRRSDEHRANTEFHAGNHWQDGEGWIGEKPSAIVEGQLASNIGLEKIKSGFVSENVIGEVNDRHVGGILGREVNWDFVTEDLYRKRRDKKTASEAARDKKDNSLKQVDIDLTAWWNECQPKSKLREALTTALNEERALLRFFIPPGLRDKEGRIPAPTAVPEALRFIHVDVKNADKGGVFVDSDTQQPFSVYVYGGENENESLTGAVEVSWVDNGITYLKLLSDTKTNSEPYACDLGGRLWMYELRRKPLITEQVRSLQRALNLVNTMMMRNVNLAGSRERYFLNVERPSETVRIPDTAQLSGYREEIRPLTGMPIGAGASNFLKGELITDKDGVVVDRADPNVQITDPAAVTTFTTTRDQLYTAILSQCQQIHALISGDATASGRSREQARAEFESSLRLSKEVVDDAGRWLLDTALRLAAHLSQKTPAYAGLRCDFNTIIETGPISPEERQANREDVKAGLLSKESAMSRAGVEDVDAERARIAEDKEDAPAPVIPPPLPQPTNGDSQVIQ